MSGENHEISKWPAGQVAVTNLLMETNVLPKDSLFLSSHAVTEITERTVLYFPDYCFPLFLIGLPSLE